MSANLLITNDLARSHGYNVFIGRLRTCWLRGQASSTWTALIANPGRLARLQLPESVYTGIWWYARFPEHYSDVGAAATKELGEFDQKMWSNQIAEAIKAVKAGTQALELQNGFFEETTHPLGTKQ